MNFQLGRGITIGESHPPIPPHLSLVAPFARSTMAVQGGVML